jgi:hypothetical protein
MHEGPQVEILADELGAFVETNRVWVANLLDDARESLDDVGSPETLPHIDRRRRRAPA